MEKTVESRVAESEALYDQALRIIPWGTQTGSKRPPEDLRGFYPPYIERGQGAYVFDLDGNRYIDYKLACGPIILGHAYKAVDKAVMSKLEGGIVYGSAHPLEVQVAQELIRLIPCAEMVRFLKTGAEGAAATVRLARAHTGRDKIVSFGYHGWHDWCVNRGKGIPAAISELTISLPYEDADRLEETLRQNRGQVAGVVVTPPIHGPQQWNSLGSFLETVQAVCEEYGVLLIFDEIVSGFRTAIGGIQERFDIVPDLAVFSKAIANGFPISAVVGRREVMEAWDEVVITSTFGGETMSLAAALATIHELEQQDVLAHIWRLGQRLIEGVNDMAERMDLDLQAGGCPATPSLLSFVGDDEERNQARLTDCLKELLRRGIMPYSGTCWYLCFSHTEEDVENTLQAIGETLEVVRGRQY